MCKEFVFIAFAQSRYANYVLVISLRAVIRFGRFRRIAGDCLFYRELNFLRYWLFDYVPIDTRLIRLNC